MKTIILPMIILTIILVNPFFEDAFAHVGHRRNMIKGLVNRVKAGDRHVLRLRVFDTFLAIHGKTYGQISEKAAFRNRSRLFGWRSLPAYLGGLRNQDPRVRYLCMKNILRYIDPIQAKSFNFKNIQSLKEIDLKGLPLRDEELTYIDDYKSLKALYLQATEITDKGLKHIKKLKHLQKLDLSASHVNGKGLVYLRDLKHLKELHLSYQDIKYPGELVKLVHIESLNLEGTNIIKTYSTNPPEPFDTRIIIKYNNELKFLYKLGNLKTLSLAETWLNDDALRDLKHLNNLKILDISYTEITDKGIKHLMSFKSLKELYIHNNNISKSSMKKLEKALPKCKIYY